MVCHLCNNRGDFSGILMCVSKNVRKSVKNLFLAGFAENCRKWAGFAWVFHLCKKIRKSRYEKFCAKIE